MSCTFWVRRKRRVAAALEKKQAAEKAVEPVSVEPDAVKKPRKKAVNNDDKTTG